jgi:hypothetical protein
MRAYPDMVLSAKMKNMHIIKELLEINRNLGSIQGNVENAALGLGKKNEYAAHLLRQASEIRFIIKINEQMIRLITGEDVELEKERKALEIDAEKFCINALKTLAEA